MMVVLCELRCFCLWLIWWCFLMFVKGSISCQNNCTGRRNIRTELQSDVLLPCYFEPNLLGSDKTADIAAVWSYRNITVDNLLEISLQGKVRSWNMRSGRIETFPKLSESGNFSILLHKVQHSDLGLYHCQLFDGINCSIGYQEIQLGNVTAFEYKTIIGASGGGVLLICLFTVCVCYIGKKRRPHTRPEEVCGQLQNPIYESVSYTVQP